MARIKQNLRGFLINDKGVIAILFAVSIPMLILSVGIGVDVTKAYQVKQRLAQAIDHAALAGSTATGTVSEREDFIRAYIRKNFDSIGGATLDDADIAIDLSDPSSISISATATSINTFMPFFSKDTVTVSSLARVNRSVKAEIVMVVDNSTSMNNSGRLTNLKAAMNSFVTTLTTAVPDPDFYRIGIVPYNHTVSVGSYGIGENPDGTYYDTPFVDVNIPPFDGSSTSVTGFNTTYSTSDWTGVVAEEVITSESDFVTSSDIEAFRFCVKRSNGKLKNSCVTAEGSTPATATPFHKVEKLQSVLPLTNNLTDISNKISSLDARGGTYSNYGLLWGWRLISPGFPFTEGASYSDNDWKKFIILMTDGNNNINDYSGLGLHPNEVSYSDSDLDDALLRICNNVKSNDIVIFTITFTPSISASTISKYEQCSTVLAGESGYPRYINASNGVALTNAFDSIANQIANTYLAR
jgi:Flp pilus assembly protein TadG